MEFFEPLPDLSEMDKHRPTYAFTELTREAAVEKCLSLNASGVKWHIHSLNPGCRFNHRTSKYCFIVEDTDHHKTWCVFSDDDFSKECQQLVQVLHGESILDASARPEGFDSPAILDAARACVATGEAWHHHMMKPGCILSPQPERHVITLERASTPEMQVHASDTAPDDVQREIELLYFSRN
jgi:hypothetical protein